MAEPTPGTLKEGYIVRLKGIIQAAGLVETTAGGEEIEMVLRVQGVGPGQPRRIVIPYEILLQDSSLSPEDVNGHGFEADVDQIDRDRWLVSQIAVAGRRVLRKEE